MRRPGRRHAIPAMLAVALGVEAASLAVIAWRIDPVATPRLLAAAWIVAAVSAIAALALLRRTQVGIIAILAAGVALRLALLPAEPTLSDDVWRYLHDGRAQLAGLSPYALAPADDATLPFRGPEHPRINHPHLVTIYPPAAQLAFALNALAGSSLLGWKLLLLAAELLLMIGIAALLRARARDDRLLALYAWHPLAIIEIAGNAHLEPIALAPLLLALTLAARGRPVRAAAAIGLSVAARFWMLPLLPFLARHRLPGGVAACAATVAVLYAPYVAAGAPVLGSAGVFVDSWSSNAGAFLFLQRLTGSRSRALLAAAVLLAVLLAWLWRRRAPAEDAAFAFVFATLLVAPVVHPWYVLWLAALLPVIRAPRLVHIAAAWWTLTAPAAYAVLPDYALTGEWQVPTHAVVIQLAPVLLLLAAAAAKAAIASSPPPVGVPAR